MASIITTNGLQRLLVQALQATAVSGPTYDVARYVRQLSADDQAGAFAAGHDQLNDVGTVTNSSFIAFDAAPTNTANVSTIEATFSTAQANFVHKRIALHDTASPTTSTTSLVAGVDGLSITKNSDFTLTYRFTLTLTDAS